MSLRRDIDELERSPQSHLEENIPLRIKEIIHTL